MHNPNPSKWPAPNVHFQNSIQIHFNSSIQFEFVQFSPIQDWNRPWTAIQIQFITFDGLRDFQRQTYSFWPLESWFPEFPEFNFSSVQSDWQPWAAVQFPIQRIARVWTIVRSDSIQIWTERSALQITRGGLATQCTASIVLWDSNHYPLLNRNRP